MINKFIATGIVIGAALAVSALAAEKPVRPAQDRPNIILRMMESTA